MEERIATQEHIDDLLETKKQIIDTQLKFEMLYDRFCKEMDYIKIHLDDLTDDLDLNVGCVIERLKEKEKQ